MRYEDFDDYEYSRSSSRRSSSSGDYRSADRNPFRDLDSNYGRDYQDFDRYSGRSDSYDRGYQGYDRYDSGRFDDYDRYGSSGRSNRFDDFDRYNWERTAPNWDRKSAPAPRKRRPSERPAERSVRSSGRSPSRDSRDRRDTRERRENRDRRDSRSSRGSAQSSRRYSAESQRRGDRRGRGSTYEQERSFKLLPIIIAVVVLVAAAILVKFLLSDSSSDEYQIAFQSETIVVGETTEATISGLPEGDSPSVNWISGDTSVVTIEESDGPKCTLTAKSEGTATIAATITPSDGGKEISISGTLKVVKTAPGVLGITMANETATVYSGEDYTVSATVNMEDGYSPAKISWSSSDASVARVSEEGVVSARDVGTAIITATAGEKTAEIVITVVENPNGTPPDNSQLEGQAPSGESAITGTSPSGGGGSSSSGSSSTDSGTGTGDSSGSTAGSGTGSSTGSSGGSTGSTGGSTDNAAGTGDSSDSSQLSGSITGASPSE